jgi:hypothetical protein
VPQTADLITDIPDPEAVRAMLVENARRREVLRSLLRTALRKKRRATPPPRPSGCGTARRETAR